MVEFFSCRIYNVYLQVRAIVHEKMSGFDEGEIFYRDVFGSEDNEDESLTSRIAAQKQFMMFIRDYHEGTFVYPYRYCMENLKYTYFKKIRVSHWLVPQKFC